MFRTVMGRVGMFLQIVGATAGTPADAPERSSQIAETKSKFWRAIILHRHGGGFNAGDDSPIATRGCANRDP